MNPSIPDNEEARAAASRPQFFQSTTQPEGQYRLLFQNNPLPMWVIDRETLRFLAVNTTAIQHYGYSEEEFLGMTVFDIHPPAGRTRLSQILAESATRPTAVNTNQHQKRNGAVIDVRVTAQFLTFAGRPVRLATAEDITTRKRLEKEILEISERERQRMGQDLHDHLIQQLVGIAYLNGVLCRKLAKQCPAQAAEGARIAELLNQAISSARGMVRGLFPVPLDANGLVFALRELAQNVTETHKIRCRFVRVGPPWLNDTAAATHLYRICQEAVRNALTHGKATRVFIRLASEKQILKLAISNNGRDFRTKPIEERGFGLDVMRFRAASIGARLDVQRKPGGGTIVTCLLHQEASGEPREADRTRKER